MADVGTAFLTAGVILIIGFLASYLFTRTGFPDVIALMLLGVVLGPLNMLVFHVHQLDFISDTSTLNAVTPYLIGLAFALVLFDGGLNFPMGEKGGSATVAIIFSSLTMFLSVLVTTVVVIVVLGYPLLVAILLGIIIGGINSDVVLWVVHHLPLDPEASKYLQIDAIYTDIIGILLAIGIVGMIANGTPLEIAATGFLISIGIGVVGGLLIGYLWKYLWKYVHEVRYAFILTIAVLVLTYGLVEVLGGSGACASFLFGLILGHTGKGRREESSITWDLKPFCGELTFSARTFFYVLLGLVFSISGVRNVGMFVIAVALIIVGFFIARQSSVRLAVKANRGLRGDERVVTMVMARGVGAAILAMLPFNTLEYVAGTPYYMFMSPFQGEFIDIAFMVIIATIALTAIGTGTNVGGLSSDKESK